MKINKKYKYFLLGLLIIILLSFLLFYMIKEDDISDNELYQKLMNRFNIIFPDNNRNGGGPQYYHHIVNMNPTINEYKRYNKFYCAVSGSPIDPNRDKIYDNIVVKDLNDIEYYGKYYRCCWPCLCDIMRDGLVRVENIIISLKDGDYDHYVLTINDPCKKENNIPEEITSYKCNNKETTNGIHTDSGRLIIGVFHDVERYNIDIHDIKDINDMCESRNNTPVNELRGGMGDLSVQLYSL
tara:strand:- start:156 stop:875 length:720 start_codon:yes stop_codon:yes gene_type:complete